MTTERGKAALLGAAGGSIVTLLLAKVTEARAAGPPPGVDPEVWDMYLTVIETSTVQAEQISELNITLNSLVVALGGAPAVEVEDPFKNTEKFVTGQVICTTANRGFQLPAFPIPKNKQFIVKALPGNVGWIYVGSTQVDSQNLVVAYVLVPNEGVGLFIKNSDTVWVMAPIVNDGVTFVVEAE